MDHDLFSGDGSTAKQAESLAKPECRNDHESGFVSRQCGYECIAPIMRIGVFTGALLRSESGQKKCYLPYAEAQRMEIERMEGDTKGMQVNG